MKIYFFLYALLTLGALLKHWMCNNRSGNRMYCIFAFILIAGMLALRHPTMGIDLHYGFGYGYLGAYESIGSSDWAQVLNGQFYNYEKGYVIFCKLASYISAHSQTLLILCAVISIGAISRCIYRYSDDLLLSFVIYLGLPLFLANYSVLRQVLAVAITVCAYGFIRKKKLTSFFMTVMLACTFHKSAIIFLAAYPLYYFRPFTQWRIIPILLLPMVYLFRYQLFHLMAGLFSNNAQPDNNSAVMLFLVFTAMYLFSVCFSDKNDIHEEGLNNLFWMACICQAFGGVYATAMRVGYYFMVYLALLLPKKLTNIKAGMKQRKNIPRMIAVVIFVGFCAFGLYSIYTGSWAMSYPYSFFWQEQNS